MTDARGNVTTEISDATSYLLGLRYLSEANVNNFELRLRLYLLHGSSSTDFGEKPNDRKLEFYVRYYF